jgi:hypothetical protein
MDEIWEWLQSLNPNFALLLALPCLVLAHIENKIRLFCCDNLE